MTTDRSLDSAVDGILDDAYVLPVWFAKFEFDSGTLYLHTDLGSITTLSQTWTGVGDLGSVSGLEESEKARPYTIAFRLSGLDTTILDEALNQNYFERPCTLYLGFRDPATGALKAAPDEQGQGRCDVMQVIDDAGASQIELTVESEMSDWDQAPLAYLSDSQLQSEHSGDLLLEYLPQMKNLRIVWGRSNFIVLRGAQGGGAGGWKLNNPTP